jgi:ABC-2 type transport system permease protein
MTPGFYPIYRREMRSYLTSPSVYVAVAAYLFLTGLFFYGILLNFSELSANAEYRRQMGFEQVNFTRHVVSQLFWSSNFLLLFVVPVFTMRLIADERRTGTFEMLRSLPFTDWNIVIGKYLAAYTLVAAMLAVNSYHILILARYGDPEMSVVAVAFLGGLIMPGAYVAIGLFASSLTENQIVAAIIAFVILLLLFLAGDVTAPGATGWGRLLELFSMRIRSEQFTMGLLRLEDIAYFVMIATVFLFLTCRILELTRWRV